MNTRKQTIFSSNSNLELTSKAEILQQSPKKTRKYKNIPKLEISMSNLSQLCKGPHDLNPSQQFLAMEITKNWQGIESLEGKFIAMGLIVRRIKL